MNLRVIILAAITIIGGIGVYFLSQSVLSNQQAGQQQAAKPSFETVDVMTASRNLSVGSVLKVEDVQWSKFPKNGLNGSYLINGTNKPEDLVGKVVRYSMTVGEPVVMNKVVSQGQQGYLAAILNPNMRAVTIGITNVTGVAGFVLPGDRVDVILTHKVPDETGIEHIVSETILRNLRILAVDQRSGDGGTNPILGKTATLEVTPKLAEKFTMLTRLGTISLALRSLAENEDGLSADQTTTPEEIMITRTWDMEVSPLFGDMDETADSKKKKKTGTVTINRGGAEQVVELDG